MSSLALKLIGVLALLAAVAFGGWHARSVVAERDALVVQTKLDAAVVAAGVAENDLREAQTAKTTDSTARIDAEEPKQQVVVQTVTKQVIKYVQDPSHGKCAMPADWVRAYNESLGLPDAASVPATGPAPDGSPAAVAAPDLGTGHRHGVPGNNE